MNESVVNEDVVELLPIGDETALKIIKALGLPRLTTKLVLTFQGGGIPPKVECESFIWDGGDILDASLMDESIRDLSEYELHEIKKATI